MNSKRHDLGDRLFEYAARIVCLVESLSPSIVGKRVGDQLLRSGTSSGANYEEAQAAESHDDFVHKLQIALKEMRESNFWLRLLARTKIVPMDQIADLIDESNQLKAMLSKSVATAKGTSKSQKSI
ncbi:MAG: four helix bundle protein [Blastocatellia bacterium]|nr:four helix bundle protein [Blastocatellia bacterium]